MRTCAMKDEKGLSTLEWMLIVAAVGGLATLGVLIVRSSLGSTDDIEETVDNPTVMAARESVVGISSRAECLTSDAGGHMGVKAQWDADAEECIIVEGANRNAASVDDAAAIISHLLSTVDTSGRMSDAERGCTEDENADGFFSLDFEPGSTLELTLPTLTECSEGKWASGAAYDGYTFKSAEVLSVTRCYTEGIGNQGVMCAEDKVTTISLGDENQANGADQGNTLGDPDGGGATPQRVSLRNDARRAEDGDILYALALGVSAESDKIICSSDDSDTETPACQVGTTTISSGLFRVVLEITIERDSNPDLSYRVTDYLFVFSS